MLSAIAARKAAQVESQNLVGRLPTAFSRVEDAGVLDSRVSKRKLTGQTATTSNKKPSKRKKERNRQTQTHQDIADADLHADADLDSGAKSLAEQLQDYEDDSIFTVPTIVKTNKRSWSPSRPINDSSEEEENDQVETSGSRQTFSSVSEPSFTPFRPLSGSNVFPLAPEEFPTLGIKPTTASATVVFLSPSDSLSFVGTYSFLVLKGPISFAGTSLCPSKRWHNVYSPRSSPVPSFQIDLSAPNSGPDAMKSLPDRLRPLDSRNGAVIVLIPLSTGVRGLGNICGTFEGVFEPRWKANEVELPGVPGAYIVNMTQNHPFVLPYSWMSSLASFTANGFQNVAQRGIVCLIKGAKNSGKSTVSRIILNRLLNYYRKVAYLECDVGQSEFTPGGMVALNVIEQLVFGPPFTHPTLPYKAHYTGCNSPKSSPSHYLTSIQDLIQCYHLDIRHTVADSGMGLEEDDNRAADVIPLVVNTMGWTKGLGADLGSKLEEIVQPTDVFEFEAQQMAAWGATTGDKCTSLPYPQSESHRHFMLEPIPLSQLSLSYTPADHRNLSILSYLHASFPTQPVSGLRQVTATSWKTDEPLCARLPYDVELAAAFDQIVLVGAGSEDVVPSEVSRVLNGALVGLICCDPGTIDEMKTRCDLSSSIPYSQGSSPPEPSSSACKGLALIRSLSPTSSHLQILTPVPVYELEDCRILVKGELELPIWGMIDYRERGGEADNDAEVLPYLRWGRSEGAGGDRRRVRRNLMRKGQM